MTTTTQTALDVYCDELQQDVRYGLRLLRRRPGVAAIVIATLAIAIGGNVAIFSAIRAVLLKPLPYSHSDQVVRLGEIRPATPSYSGAISAPNYLDWMRENTVFNEMAAETGGEVTLDRGTSPPIYIAGRIVSPSVL